MSSPLAGERASIVRPDFADLTTQSEIALFLAHEAALLDERHFHEWVELVADDFVYQVPTPITPDSPFKPHYDERSMLIDESKWSMSTQWFRRFDEDIYEMAWGENPPVRFRHFVTNVIALRTTVPDVYEVSSNVLLVATRQSHAPKYVTGKRTDTVVRHDGEFVLKRRWVVLDQVVIDFPQLRIIL